MEERAQHATPIPGFRPARLPRGRVGLSSSGRGTYCAFLPDAGRGGRVCALLLGRAAVRVSVGLDQLRRRGLADLGHGASRPSKDGRAPVAQQF